MLISEQSPGVVFEQTPRRSLSRSHTLSLADSAAGTCSMRSGCQGESVQSKNTTWMCVCALPVQVVLRRAKPFFKHRELRGRRRVRFESSSRVCLLLQKCAERVAEHRSWRAQTAIRSERVKDIVLIPSQSDRRLFVWRRCKTDRFSVCSYVTCKHELNKSGDANMPARWDELVRVQRLYLILCCLELLFFPAVSNEIFEFQILASWRLHWSLERHRRQKNLASRDPSVQFCASSMKTLVITADL